MSYPYHGDPHADRQRFGLDDAPDFSAQTADVPTGEQHAWFRARADEMRKEGATWLRFARHPDNPSLILVEGWRVRPDREPPPCFHLTAAEREHADGP